MQFVAVLVAALSVAFLAEATQVTVGSAGSEYPLGGGGGLAQAIFGLGGYRRGLLGKSIRYSSWRYPGYGYGVYPGYGVWYYGGYPAYGDAVHYVSHPGYGFGYGSLYGLAHRYYPHTWGYSTLGNGLGTSGGSLNVAKTYSY